MNKWVEFSVTSFGTLKYDHVIKTIQMFNFLLLINNSVTAGFTYIVFFNIFIKILFTI